MPLDAARVSLKESSSPITIPAPAQVSTGNPTTNSKPSPATTSSQLPPPLAKLPAASATTPEALLLQDAQLIDQRIDAPDARGQVRRIEVYRTKSFKYQLVRVEEWFTPTLAGPAKLTHREFSVADHVMVRFPAAIDEARVKSWATAQGFTIRRKLRSAPVYLVATSRSDVDAADAIMQAYQKAFPAAAAAYAERDFLAFASVIPNDTSFSSLWGMNNTGQSGGVADADIDAPEAWDIMTGSRSTLVGIIDSGFDRTHPDLAANAWVNPGEIAGNGIDDDRNGFIDDVQGWDFYNDDNNPMDDNQHGTHCAGTIGAVGGNSSGVAGVCWQVSIVGLKFLSSSGGGTTSDAVDATNYATSLGVALTSNSWGGGGFSQTLKDAIDAAGNADILFVAAAGNASSNNDSSPSYPASYTSANVISVASTTRTDALSSFSNFGLASVDLGAPGSEIYSTVPGGSYATLSGTSMATPHVSGALALVKSAAPVLTAATLKQRLLATTDPIPALSGKTVSGGRLNVGRFLQQSAGPLPMISSTIITEGAGANGDTILNPGEPVSIGITVTNRGTETATNVSATLSTTAGAGSQFTIAQSTLAIGNLAVGASNTPASTFAIRSFATTTTPYLESFTITITFGSPSKQTTYTLPMRINTTSHITGQVTELVSGNPVSGAKVSFDGPASGVSITNAQGSYDYVAIDGTFAVNASAPGFLTSSTQSISVPPSRSAVNFALRLPNLSLQPPSISVALNAGDTSQQTVTLGNRGAVPLTWDLRLANVSITAVPRLFRLPELPATGEAPDSPDNKAARPIKAGVLPTSRGVEAPLGSLKEVRVGFLTITDSSTIRSDLTQRGAKVTLMSSPLSAASLNNVDVVVFDDVLTYLTTSDVTELRKWLQAGGALLTEGDDSASMPSLNSILSGTGLGGTYRGYNDVTITDFRPHAITQGITSIFEAAAGATFSVGGSAVALAVEPGGSVHAAVSHLGQGTVIVVGNEITDSSNFGTGQARQLANQMIDYLALTAAPQWVTADKSSGVVPAGGSGSVRFSLDSSGLLAGDYRATGLFANNDAAAPEVELPIAMHITGTPSIRLDHTGLAFGHVPTTSLDGTILLTVTNPGTDQLDVTSFFFRGAQNTAFTIGPNSAFSLAPGGSKVLSVQFAAPKLGDYAAELVFESNAFSNPTLVVPVKASRVHDPKISITPSEGAHLTMRQGERRWISFVVRNSGKGILDWQSALDSSTPGTPPPKGFALAPTSGSVPPGGQTTVTLTVNGSNFSEGLNRHLLYFLSRDASSPVDWRTVNIEVKPAPIASISPSELRFPDTFNYAGKSIRVTVTNTGRQNLEIKGAFTTSAAFAVEPIWPLRLGPGEHRDFGVGFHPTTLGLHAGQIVLSSNAGSARAGIPVTGLSVQGPIATIAPSSLALTVEPGEMQTRTITLGNKGAAQLEWTMATSQSKNSSGKVDFVSFDPPSGTTAVKSAGKVTMKIDATNVSAGTFACAAVANTNDPLHREVKVPLVIKVKSGSRVIANPSSLAFADTYVGASPSLSFEVLNTGNTVIGVKAPATSNSAFRLASGGAFALAPAEARLIEVLFIPGAPGDQSGIIDFVTDSAFTPVLRISVQGKALPPPIASVSKASITVTADPGDTTTSSFALHNTGDSPLQWSAAVAGAASCASLDFTSGAVQAHSSQPLTLAFSPTSAIAAGQFSGMVTLTTDDPLHKRLNVVIALTVTGKPRLAITPSPATFAPIYANTQATKSINLQNTGNLPLVISKAQSSPAEFSLSGLTFPLTINPGSGVSSGTVRFAPTTTGSFSGTLTFNTNRTDTPQTTLSLSGQATAGPDISIAPASIADNIDPGQTLTKPLVISNPGGAALHWSTSSSPIYFQEGAPAASLVSLPEYNVEFHDPDAPTSGPHLAARVEPLEASLATLTGIKIATLVSSSSGVLSDAIARGATVTALTRPLSAAKLAGYHLLIWDDTVSSLTSTEVTDVRAWVSSGGGLLLEGDDSSISSSNSVLASTGVTITPVSYANFTTTAILPHPTTTGITSLTESSAGAELAVSGPSAAIVVRKTAAGPVFAAATTLGLGNIFVVGNEIIDGIGTQERLWGNQIIDWLAGQSVIGISTRVLPSSGTVPVGNSTQVSVQITAPADAIPGVHNGNLVFASDTPLKPAVTIPLSITVAAKPVLTVSPSSLALPAAYVDGKSSASLTLRNSGNTSLIIGAATVSGAGFSITGVNFPLTIPKGSSTAASVNFSPLSPGSFTGSIALDSNAGPTPVTVQLSGTASQGPQMSISPVRLDEAMDPSQTISRQITIGNTGPVPLNWSTTSVSNTSVQITATPSSGVVMPNTPVTMDIKITTSSTALAGLSAIDFLFSSDDPHNANRVLPIGLTINARPSIGLSPASITFPTTFRFGQSTTAVVINNPGNAPLVLSSVTSNDSAFDLAGLAFPVTIPAGGSVNATARFHPSTTGSLNASLVFASNASSTPQLAMAVTGLAISEPQFSVSPASVQENLNSSDTLLRPLTIANSGGSSLTWNASLQNTTGATDSPLDNVRQRLGTSASTLTALIPNLFAFSEGSTGYYIYDGGSDMYDGGNYLGTSLGSSIPYSDNVITTNSSVGSGSFYFTLKTTGLFAFVGDLAGATSFGTTGDLGADGGGSVSGTVLTSSSNGRVFNGFVKRVYGTGDPSVNHLIIVENKSGVSHNFATSTNSDQHTLTGLSGTTRVCYLLFATSNGGMVSDATFQSVLDYFVSTIAAEGFAPWISLDKNGSSTSSGGTSTLNCTLTSNGLNPGLYTATIHFTTNDPRNITFDVPVSVNIRAQPLTSVSPPALGFGPQLAGTTASKSVTVSSTGNAPLVISSASLSNPAFTVSGTFPQTIPVGHSLQFTLNFAPGNAGVYSGSCTFNTNATGGSPATVSLTGSAESITVAPTEIRTQITLSDAMSHSVSLAITTATSNTTWTALKSASWINLNTSGGTGSGPLTVTITRPAAAIGTYTDQITLVSGGRSTSVPVTVEVINDYSIVKLEADQTLNVVYALARDTASPNNARLLWIDASTAATIATLDLQGAALDFVHHASDDRIYTLMSDGVTVKSISRQGLHNVLSSWVSPSPVDHIVAGLQGRVITSRMNLSSTAIFLHNSATGGIITSQTPYRSEVVSNPATNNIYTVYEPFGNTAQSAVSVNTMSSSSLFASTITQGVPYNTARTPPFVVSRNGQMLFYLGKAINPAILNSPVCDLGTPIYAASPNGAIAYGSSRLLEARTGVSLGTLPFSSTLMAAASDGSHLVMVNPSDSALTSVAVNCLTVSESNMSFGSSVIGSSVPRSLTITNNSNQNVTISISSTNGRFSSSSSSVPVGAGLSISITVNFTPATVTTETGTLTLSISNQPALTRSVAVTGTGTAAVTGTVTASFNSQIISGQTDTQSGLRITSSSGSIQWLVGGTANRPDNGTPFLDPLSGQVVTIVRADNGTFSPLQIDLAEYSTVFQTPTSIVFNGTRLDGSTVTTTFTTDGIIDGTGPATDFQTFTFPGNFTQLTSLSIPTMIYAMDNLVFSRDSASTSSPEGIPDTSPASTIPTDIDADGIADVAGITATRSTATSHTLTYTRLTDFRGELVQMEASSDGGHTWTGLRNDTDFHVVSIVKNDDRTETIQVNVEVDRPGSWQFRLTPQP